MRPIIHASSLFAPLVMLTSLASFAFGASAQAIEETTALFVLVPLSALVASVLGQRRAGALVAAHALCLLSLALAVYGAAIMSAAHPELSIAERPSLVIAVLASAWGSAAVAALSAERSAEPL